MTKQDALPTETSVIEQVPLDSLTLSDLNPRKTVSEAHIDTLAASIARFGLIQNLAGLRHADGRVEIVAGGCRLRALQQIVAKAETPSPATVPVRLTEDPEEAAVWASAENAAREALTPADEIRAFGAMAAKGASVADIALAFAVGEARVYQRLALAALPQPVLDALAAGEITLGAAKAFTLSEDAALTLTLGARLGRDDMWTGFDTLHFQSAVTSTNTGVPAARRAETSSSDQAILPSLSSAAPLSGASSPRTEPRLIAAATQASARPPPANPISRPGSAVSSEASSAAARRVMAPVCQCSSSRPVISTMG